MGNIKVFILCCLAFATGANAKYKCEPVPKTCDPKECERGYVWFPDPICQCYLACDYIMECNPGMKWDFIECGCVDACPGVLCEENYLPDESCECQCGLTQANCTDYERFDSSSCSCFVEMGCDYILQCSAGEKWDFGICGCVPIECPGVEKCQENAAFNENCECQCTNVPEECNGYFDFDTCKCIEDRCDYVEQCPPGLKWSLDVCNCVVIECPDHDSCGENYVFDENCQCQCGIDESSCQPYEIFDESNCHCTPNWGCDYIMECPLGEKWDSGVCGCIPNECPGVEKCQENHLFDESCSCRCTLNQELCSEQDPDSVFDYDNCRCTKDQCSGLQCNENQVINQETCSCDCQLTEETCQKDGPLAYLDFDFCECRRHPCDPPWPCPDGEMVDYEFCGCVSDPNYTSTSTPPECIEVPCRNRYVWLQDACECVCPPMFCEEGTTHGSDCDCVPDPNYCSPLECPENAFFNSETCSCECTLTEESCTGPRSFLDQNSCQCRMHPCDPVRPCVEGEILDLEICGCVPDPNYSTTVCPSKSKSKSHEKSHSKSHSKSHEKKDKKKGSDQKKGSHEKKDKKRDQSRRRDQDK